MNILHRRYCRSDGWRQAVHHGMMPWVLGEIELGASTLEIGPGPGVTTEWLRERVTRLTCVEIDRQLADSLKARLEGTNVAVVEGVGENRSQSNWFSFVEIDCSGRSPLCVD